MVIDQVLLLAEGVAGELSWAQFPGTRETGYEGQLISVCTPASKGAGSGHGPGPQGTPAKSSNHPPQLTLDWFLCGTLFRGLISKYRESWFSPLIRGCLRFNAIQPSCYSEICISSHANFFASVLSKIEIQPHGNDSNHRGVPH